MRHNHKLSIHKTHIITKHFWWARGFFNRLKLNFFEKKSIQMVTIFRKKKRKYFLSGTSI
jgi:hypothetical protein